MKLKISSPLLYQIERFDDFLKFFYFIHNFKVNRCGSFWTTGNVEEETKMPRFLFLRSATCTTFCFALIELRNQHVSMG